MINPEIINARLMEMRENLVLLDEIKSIPFGKFRDDPKIFKLSLYCLQTSIQCLLDICHHIIVDNDWPRPRDNREAIEIIARYKIIPEKFSKIILPMAGLRNILVHEYFKVNPDIIISILSAFKTSANSRNIFLPTLKRPIKIRLFPLFNTNALTKLSLCAFSRLNV